MSPETAIIALAAFAMGLWLGERGRRLDAQRREGVLQVDKPRPATTIQPQSVNTGAEDYKAARERFVVETMAEVSCSRAEAEAEYDRLMQAVSTDSVSS